MKWISGILVVVLLSPSQAADESIDRLRAQYAAWRREVQFHSTYELREGTADDFADVFDGTPFDRVATAAHGVFSRMDNLLRISIDYGAQTEAQSLVDLSTGAVSDPQTDEVGNLVIRPGQALLVSNASEDEVTDGDRWLVYRPRWRNSNDRVVLSRISSSPGREASTGQYRISPLNPFPGFNPDPFGGEAFLGEDPEFEIESSGTTTIVSITSVAGIDDRDYSQTNTIELWTKPERPVIQRIHRLITVAGGELYLEREARLSDFRECPGGFVARRVLFASRSRNDSEVRVTEWISADLGDREPVDEDFQITIPETTVIVGAAAPLPTGQVRTLDIRDLVGP